MVKTEDVDTIFVNWKDLIACNNTFLRYFIFIVFIVEYSLTLTPLTKRALRIRKKMSPGGVIQVVGDILIDHVSIKLDWILLNRIFKF